MSMDEIRVRLPRVLDATGSSLRERGRLHPIGPVSITLNIAPLHRVTLTLAESDLPLAMHDLVEVYNQNGSVGVYRVKHIGDTKRKERQIELAHGLDTLSDAHIAVIENYKGNVEGMLRKILAAQKQPIGGVIPWVLGVCEDPNPWTKEIKYDNALECLTDIAKTEEDYMFTFDMSVFPWVLNFVRRDSTVMSEWRMNRNVDQCQISWDDGDQCTRLYLSVTDEDSETVTDKNNQNHTIVTVSEGYYPFDDAEGQADWGIVEKPAGVDRASVPTQAALDAWVAGYFNRHRQPALQIQIDGQEYVRITGERLDEAHMGRISRVTMPEYKSVFNERLVSVTYPDALRKPTLVRLSLANKRQTSEGSFAEIRQKTSRASSGASSARATAQNAAAEIEKQKIRYDLRVEQDDRHWAIIASEEWFDQMAGDEMTLIGKYTADFGVTARKIGAALSVTGVKLDNNGMPVKDSQGNYEFDGSGNTLSAQIDAQAEQIRAKVSSTDVKKQIEAYGYIDVTALSSKIGAVANNNGVITAASIAAAVDPTTHKSVAQMVADIVDITGDKVSINGSTLKLNNVITADNSGALINATVVTSMITDAGMLTFSSMYYKPTAQAAASQLNPLVAVKISGPSNNEYKLQYKRMSDSDYQDGETFSRAASGVSVSWSGTTGTVTVQPQNQDFTITDDAQVSSVALLKIGSNISIAPYINHGQTDTGGNPTNERNSSAWNISATAPALTGAIPSGHNAGTGVGPAPTAKSAIAPGDTVIPYIQIDGKYFYGSSTTVASGANVEASHPHSMTTASETVTPSNGFDAMAQVVVDASDLVSDTWDAATNVIEATTGGITIPLEGAYGDNPNTTKLNLYLKQDANWSSEYKKNVYIRDVDNIVANQGTTIATAEVDASGVYTQGWADAELKLNIPTSSDNPSAFLSISYPDKTKTSKQSSVTYSLTDNSAEHKVQLKVGGDVVAEQAYTPGSSGYGVFDGFASGVPSQGDVIDEDAVYPSYTRAPSSNSISSPRSVFAMVTAAGGYKIADTISFTPINSFIDFSLDAPTSRAYTPYTGGNITGPITLHAVVGGTSTLYADGGSITITPQATGYTGLSVDAANHQIVASSSSSDTSVTITADEPTITWNESTEDYTITVTAKAGSTQIATNSGTLVPTQAWSKGYSAGYTQGATDADGSTFDGFSSSAVSGASYTKLTGDQTAPITLYAVMKKGSTYTSEGSIKVKAPSTTHSISQIWGPASSEAEARADLDSTPIDRGTLQANKWYSIEMTCGGAYASSIFKTPSAGTVTTSISNNQSSAGSATPTAIQKGKFCKVEVKLNNSTVKTLWFYAQG